MRTTVILCHPVKGSFNHAISDEVVRSLKQQKHIVHYHDLYDEGFQPVLSADELQRRFSFDEQVQLYTSRVIESDGLVFIHPDWWGGPPALLKGWIDRVFRPGVAYDFELGLLTGRAFFWRFGTFMYPPAVVAFPFYGSIFFKYLAAFNIPDKLVVSYFMPHFYFRYSPECLCSNCKSLLVCKSGIEGGVLKLFSGCTCL